MIASLTSLIMKFAMAVGGAVPGFHGIFFLFTGLVTRQLPSLLPFTINVPPIVKNRTTSTVPTINKTYPFKEALQSCAIAKGAATFKIAGPTRYMNLLD